MAIKPNFAPSATVTELANGKTRDGSFDETVRLAWQTPGKVFEEIVPDKETAEEYRKGLARSAKFLHDKHSIPVRIADEYEDVEYDEKDAKGKVIGKKTGVKVLFAAVEKRPSPRAKNTDKSTDKSTDGEQPELPADGTEGAKADGEKAPELQDA